MNRRWVQLYEHSEQAKNKDMHWNCYGKAITIKYKDYFFEDQLYKNSKKICFLIIFLTIINIVISANHK